MKQLNYNHLHYFYVVAKEGSIVAAANILHLTPQTISGQLATLENYLGLTLFDRAGKRLVLNENGKMVYHYAEDIFNLGHELLQNLEPNQKYKKMTFTVGITDVIPKIFAYDFLSPLLDNDIPIKLICKEGELEQLLADLALNKLDIILSDRTIPPGKKVKAFNHKIVDCGLTFYCAKKYLHKIKGEFPQNLNQQKLLIPGVQSSLRSNLLSWLKQQKLHCDVVAEFDDSALAKLFGQAGYGIFCTPSMVKQHIIETYNVSVIGQTDDIREQLYLISGERKLKHPAMVMLSRKLQD